jgi:hypothetical protein
VNSFPDEFIGFLNLRNLSSRTMALGSPQSLIGTNTRNLADGKLLTASKADNFTAIYESTA